MPDIGRYTIPHIGRYFGYRPIYFSHIGRYWGYRPIWNMNIGRYCHIGRYDQICPILSADMTKYRPICPIWNFCPPFLPRRGRFLKNSKSGNFRGLVSLEPPTLKISTFKYFLGSRGLTNSMKIYSWNHEHTPFLENLLFGLFRLTHRMPLPIMIIGTHLIADYW